MQYIIIDGQQGSCSALLNKGSDDRYDDRLLLNVYIDIIVYNYVQNSLHIGI